MKIVIGLLGALCLSTPAFSQDVPVLPKKWQATVTATHDGAGHASKMAPHHPDYVGAEAAKGWKTFTENNWTLTILKQEGRHILAQMTSSRSEVVWIGTLSADGKLLQVATAGASFALQIAGDKMSGCGSGKTSDAKAFNAVCFEMAAMK